MKTAFNHQAHTLTTAMQGKQIADIAQRAGISRQRLYRLIKGETLINIHEALMLSKALGIDLLSTSYVHKSYMTSNGFMKDII